MEALLIFVILVLLVIFYVIAIYNKLVKNKNMVAEGWSGIDVQLKRRANLIPNLVSTVEGYMDHERDLLENVTALRARSLESGTAEEQGQTAGLLGAALGRIFAVAENYPELKANTNFTDLHQSLDEIEEQIQLARRYYNGAARNLNILIESFPSNLVANQFRFQQATYFEIENAEDRAVPKVEFGE
jgi:LemA protein